MLVIKGNFSSTFKALAEGTRNGHKGPAKKARGAEVPTAVKRETVNRPPAEAPMVPSALVVWRQLGNQLHSRKEEMSNKTLFCPSGRRIVDKSSQKGQ